MLITTMIINLNFYLIMIEELYDLDRTHLLNIVFGWKITCMNGNSVDDLDILQIPNHPIVGSTRIQKQQVLG